MQFVRAGERIRRIREVQRMSQAELGRRVGISRQLINKYEKGVVENVGIPRLTYLSFNHPAKSFRS